MKFAHNFTEISLFREIKDNNACFRILIMLVIRHRLSFQDFLEKVACMLLLIYPLKKNTCICLVLAKFHQNIGL